MEKRIRSILQTSIVAIIVNVALGAFKAVIGFFTNSIAITLDAVNNLTDAGSSVITILSAHFAGKAPDKKHPFGYGRTEYLGTLLIGGLILYAGISALIESVTGIFSPEEVSYSTVSLIIIAVAVVVKLALTIFISRAGKKLHSDSLIAAGKESVGDVAISVSTVVAALIFIFAHVAIEAYLGVIISFLIIKAGYETLKETVGKILGTGAEAALVVDIKKTIMAHEGVKGAFDLVLHNYGVDAYMASVHVAVEDTYSIAAFDELTRTLQEEVFEKHDVYLSAVGVYCVNTLDAECLQMQDKVKEIALGFDYVNQLHGFYVNKERKQMQFDLVISFSAKDRKAVYDQVLSQIQSAYPEYTLRVGLDSDFNEAAQNE